MDAFSTELNDLLVNTFHSIMKLEEQSLDRIAKGITLNEMHMLEAVAGGKDNGRSISDIAAELDITLPSVTMAVNKLVRKGLVMKHKGEDDKRVVMVKLSPEGRRAEVAHRFFHRYMVQSITRDMTDAEEAALLRGLRKLRAFFDNQQHALDALLPAVHPERLQEDDA